MFAGSATIAFALRRRRKASDKIESLSGKLNVVGTPRVRRSRPTVWWIASIALLAIGAFFLFLGLYGQDVGPSLPHPIGKTSLSPSGLEAPSVSVATMAALNRLQGQTGHVARSSSPTVTVGTRATTADFKDLRFARSASSGLSSSVVSTSGASYRETAAKAPALTARSRTAGQVLRPLARSVPVHLSIPALGISVPLSELGLNVNGTVSVPTNFRVPGWFKYGPTPGQKGSAVILGHVDNTSGPAVFFQLVNLRIGDRVIVTLANHKTVKFAVIGLRMFTKTNFPDKLVYGPRTYSALQLVTCGGIFDHSTGHYLSNVVVFTSMVKS